MFEIILNEKVVAAPVYTDKITMSEEGHWVTERFVDGEPDHCGNCEKFKCKGCEHR